MSKTLTYRSPGSCDSAIPRGATWFSPAPGSATVSRGHSANAGLDVIAGAPATPETGTEITIIPEEEIDESLDQPWHVIIYDDPVNLMSYVTHVIQRIFGYPPGTAERMMLEVHTRGKSVVWTGSRERAEHYVGQLQSCQLLAAMKKAG